MSTICRAVRTDLSARLDGEPTELPALRIDSHIAGCIACRAWLDQAERVTRQVRMCSVRAVHWEDTSDSVRAVGVPDLTARILATVADERRAEQAQRSALAPAAPLWALGRRAGPGDPDGSGHPAGLSTPNVDHESKVASADVSTPVIS
jgi:anti-sigma factor RsiW